MKPVLDLAEFNFRNAKCTEEKWMEIALASLRLRINRSQDGNISPLKIIPVSIGSRIALGPRIKRKKWELNRISQIYSDAFRGGEDAGSARKSLFKF